MDECSDIAAQLQSVCSQAAVLVHHTVTGIPNTTPYTILGEAGIDSLVESRGDSYDNALSEMINDLCETDWSGMASHRRVVNQWKAPP